MNYIIHPAPDLTPQIQTCILAAPPCAPDCEDCAIRRGVPAYVFADYNLEPCIDPDCPWHGITAQMNKQSLAIQAAAQAWFEGPYRREYEKLVAEEEAKLLKATTDFILYGYCEVIINEEA